MAKVAHYMIYDPPMAGYPYLAALLAPGEEPVLVSFTSAAKADAFIAQGATKLAKFALEYRKHANRP